MGMQEEGGKEGGKEGGQVKAEGIAGRRRRRYRVIIQVVSKLPLTPKQRLLLSWCQREA